MMARAVTDSPTSVLADAIAAQADRDLQAALRGNSTAVYSGACVRRRRRLFASWPRARGICIAGPRFLPPVSQAPHPPAASGPERLHPAAVGF